MNDIAIRVEGLSKKFHIGRRQEKHKTLRDTLADAFVSPLRRAGKLLKGEATGAAELDETIWALKDVSFEIKRGEAVGIIGRNGSGKSTLLKILSRITEPTKGFAEIHGRVGSLLEVGTGFHQELTGRENIYLNGAILGMKRAEIDRNFDEIVAFSEVEKFIDTPVKHYSSGMYLRLAFAVAAHLEPEILLVDEVLAVGDAEFQKKCLGKMQDVAKEGRTVLFVSHNLAAVRNLCSRGILLQNGTVLEDADASKTIDTYLNKMQQKASEEDLFNRKDRKGKGMVRLKKVEIFSNGNHPTTTLATGHPARFLFHMDIIKRGMSCVFTLYDQYGQPITSFNSGMHCPEDTSDSNLGDNFLCAIDELLLLPGRYRMNVAILTDGELQDHVEAAAFFDVEQGHVGGRPVTRGTGYGCVCFRHRWIIPI